MDLPASTRTIAALLLATLFAAAWARPGLAGGAWTAAAAMPTARSELAAAALDGRIYVAGGLATFGGTKVFEVYDPAADRWDRLAQLPRSLHHFGMAAARGRIYLTGGYSGLSFSADSAEAWAYDPAGDDWTRLPDMPAPRAAHGMVNLGGKLYVVGGVGPHATALWVYDPERARWDTAPAPLPTAREHLAAVALGGELHVIGGRRRGRGNLATVEIYDPERKVWSRGRDMPTPRGGLTAAALGGRIHVTGGEAFDPGRTFDAHEVYDPETGTWSRAAPLPTARHGLASAAVAGQWYVIGGGTKAGMMTLVSLSDIVEVFTLQAGAE